MKNLVRGLLSHTLKIGTIQRHRTVSSRPFIRGTGETWDGSPATFGLGARKPKSQRHKVRNPGFEPSGGESSTIQIRWVLSVKYV